MLHVYHCEIMLHRQCVLCVYVAQGILTMAVRATIVYIYIAASPLNQSLNSIICVSVMLCLC